MPISRKRKKTAQSQIHEKQISQEPIKLDSPRWLAPLMVTSFIVGLLYVIVFDLAGSSIPGMSNLSAAANIGIGFSFIIFGFYLSTKWR